MGEILRLRYTPKYMQILGTIPYQGVRTEIVVDEKQWRSFRYAQGRFRVSPTLAKNQDKLMQEYRQFCRQQMKQIIEKHFRKLLDKRISYAIKYTDGSSKRERISAREYAKKLGIETIRYEIGTYRSEWGINQVDSKRQEFVLHFNVSLLMYDKDQKIGFVVAHEVAHIFERGHDRAFQDILQKLYPGKREYERFWDKGVAKI